MTIRTPSWLQAGSYPAENDRLLLQSLLGGSPNVAPASGIVGAADLAVTASGTPDMNVHVASGAAFIPGTETTTQGVYGFYSDGSVTVPIAASSGSNPRISLIVAEVLDAGYSGASNIGQIIEVAGTPASSPVAPAVPKNAIKLAQVLVGTSVTSITSGNITDGRSFMPTLGGLSASVTTLTGDAAWTNATLLNSWVQAGGASPVVRFKKSGKEVWLEGGVKSGTLGTAAFQLPGGTNGYRPSSTLLFPCYGSAGTFAGVQVDSSGNVTPTAGSTGGIWFDSIKFTTL